MPTGRRTHPEPQSPESRDRKLFLDYRDTSSPRARRELVERHLPLAFRLAHRYARSQEGLDDLRQVASLGLLKAIDRYDPDRGTSFATFAVPTIIGELKRYLRDTRWALHVPRQLQERAQAVAHEADRLETALGRSPTAREIAAGIGLDVEDVLEAQVAFTGFDVSSLDSPLADSGDHEAETVRDTVGAPDSAYELAEARAAIEPALAELPERDRIALRLHFIEDMTQAEVGRRLGVSQMQVSRIVRRALETLRQATDEVAA